MVKQDKVDFLDLLLGSGVDIGEILTPDSEVFPMSRFLDSQVEGIPSPRVIDNSNEVVPNYGLDFLADESDDVTMSVSTVPESVKESQSEGYETLDQLAVSTSSLQSLEDSNDDVVFLPDGEQVGAFEELADSDFVVEEVTDVSDVDITPFIKEGIRHKIRSRRSAEGKNDIQVEFRQPSPERLTNEEEERRRLRREKNKQAARKCRDKKRKRADILEMETEKLERKQEKLQDEVDRLREEKDQLSEIIKIHKSVCPKMAKICKHSVH